MNVETSQSISDTSGVDLIDISPFIADHPGQYRIARRVSDWMSPPVFGAACFLTAGLAIHTSLVWVWMALFLILGVGIPTGYVFWLARTGRVSDFHIPIRSQRIKPMLLMLGMNILVTILLLRMSPPDLLVGLAIEGVSVLLVMFLVTLKWKISGHAAAVTAFCSICTIFLGGLAGLTFLLVPVVIWARLKLHRHTVLQTIAGTALGLSTLTLLLIK
jgi:hypothetical protein